MRAILAAVQAVLSRACDEDVEYAHYTADVFQAAAYVERPPRSGGWMVPSCLIRFSLSPWVAASSIDRATLELMG